MRDASYNLEPLMNATPMAAESISQNGIEGQAMIERNARARLALAMMVRVLRWNIGEVQAAKLLDEAMQEIRQDEGWITNSPNVSAAPNPYYTEDGAAAPMPQSYPSY